jgi:hypothetical protein
MSRRVNLYKTRSKHNESAIPPKLSVKVDVADRQRWARSGRDSNVATVGEICRTSLIHGSLWRNIEGAAHTS